MASRIEDYALIGDCEAAALVARDGSIDWLCWPRFDSPACFAALLGSPGNGRWQIAPADPGFRVSRRYREGTLILETEFETADGAVTLIDFMPPRSTTPDLVRIVVGRRGRMGLQTDLVLRFGYGAIVPWVSRLEGGLLRAIAGPDMLVLRTGVPLHGEDLRTVGAFTLGEAETATFVLSYGPSHLPPPVPVEPFRALAETEAFWRAWSGRCTYQGRWSEAVSRSLITLKALTYAPTGGLVAAPTTSLPERIGGARNWDYRYCWLRDATLTLLALMNAGYYDEARAWREWLLRAVAGSPAQLQIMYGLAGERHLREWEAGWLPGYEGSRPVRIGNAAAAQLQLDVFGEVMDALHQARHGGLSENPEAWTLQKALAEHLETVWDQPDEGIWEVRGGRKHFVHSKVMAWVALDRMVKTAAEFGWDGPVARWRALRARIHADVCQQGFNPDVGAFVQSYGSRSLDASLLLLPLVGFLPASDARIRATVRAIERDLVVDGFVLRYRTEETRDGLPPGEGAFLPCSFWLVDNLMLQGRREEAQALFERLLALRNDVGLLAEEYDPRAQRQLGNFPQAFSHLALIGTALNLSTAEAKPVTQRLAGRCDP
ncbi:glycoside hydrolase family 15 protein [Microbacterium sp. ARD31]|uniref:glycoside hydrolase family 15 protein n=1 Tax=Methylobacterium fujisawaense TaxID=107400 RepID=UPI002882C8BD|nr:glycoside hydrolase family 15 protein [Microbacterium sp. ARD31]MDT0187987.1 glycoside hydrolase family 15 protein [Microbacterium sp. ARD31]MDV2987894.1 glycoside hydrolase family 15 protein [Methylobacteriaceae bacterium AG10]